MDNASPDIGSAHAAIRRSVETICTSRGFESSPRLQALLRYLVDEELGGRGARLKGYTIGIDVFDKPDSFDPSSDSSVRVAVSNLRQRLDIYYMSEQRAPVVISIPSGGYRPQFVFNDGANEKEVVQPPLTQAPLASPSWLSASRIIVSVLIFLFVSGASLWGYSRWQSAQCNDARPIVDLGGIKGVGESELVSRLQEYLYYYPIMVSVLGEMPQCSDVPHFDLEMKPLYKAVRMERVPKGYSLLLKDKEANTILWSKTYTYDTHSDYTPDELIAAQMAYDIGNGTGVIANISSEGKWGSEEAKSRFQCLVSMHDYFVDGRYSKRRGVSECSEKYWRTSSHADFKALYAALEYDGIRSAGVSPKLSAAMQAKLDEALEQAQAISPNDKELLILKMRLARNATPIQVAALEALTSQMEKYLSHEPHVIEQIGITNSSYLGNFERGFDYANRAEYLSGNHGITGWGKVMYYVATSKWNELIPLK